MNNYILFEDSLSSNFLPLSYTRHLGDLRFGITTLAEKWAKSLNSSVSFHLSNDRKYLESKFHPVYTESNVLINARIIPDAELIAHIRDLEPNSYLISDQTLIACRLNEEAARNFSTDNETAFGTKRREYSKKNAFLTLNHLTDLFSKNRQGISSDFELITADRTSSTLPSDVKLIGDKNQLFIEEGAKIPLCSINTSSGPVYIGKNVEIMEGSMLRGPLAICDNSVVKMGAKIYGATTIGPWCKVGGEINNSLMQGFSNKAHDGFLGNSVIGEWCNIGADTNCSNLKNNYGNVKIWDFEKNKLRDSKLIFCGLLMGDHSKCGINTMFNTGTTVGVNANIFGGGFPPKFIPCFSWGGENTWEEYNFEKAVEVADTVYSRRDLTFEDADLQILKHIFDNTRHTM